MSLIEKIGAGRRARRETDLTGRREIDSLELMHARDEFADVLQRPSVFANLGYNADEVKFALPAVNLVRDEVDVIHTPGEPSRWVTTSFDGGSLNYLAIEKLRNDDGFSLTAYRYANLGGDMESSALHMLTTSLGDQNPVKIFYDDPTQVAHIVTLGEEVDTDDLHSLVSAVVSPHTEAPRGVKRRNPISIAGRLLRTTATYQAAWVNENAKLEFVVKLKVPEERGQPPKYLWYRKLPVVEIGSDKVTPFGKKASASEDDIIIALAADNTYAVRGRLAVNGA